MADCDDFEFQQKARKVPGRPLMTSTRRRTRLNFLKNL